MGAMPRMTAVEKSLVSWNDRICGRSETIASRAEGSPKSRNSISETGFCFAVIQKWA